MKLSTCPPYDAPLRVTAFGNVAGFQGGSVYKALALISGPCRPRIVSLYTADSSVAPIKLGLFS